MSRSAPLFVVLAATLLLTGCGSPAPGSQGTPGAAYAIAPEAHGSANALRLQTDHIELIDASGAVISSVAYTNGQDLLDLLSSQLGSSPTATPVAASSVMTYTWDGVTLALESDTFAVVTFSAAQSAGLSLLGPEDVQVGAPRAAAQDIGTGFDTNGDNLPDEFRIDSVHVPGTTSNEDLKATGTTYVCVRVADSGNVETITAPGRDFGPGAP